MRLYTKSSVESRIKELEKSIMDPKELTTLEAIEKIKQLEKEIAAEKAYGKRLASEIDKIKVNQRE